MTQIITQIPAQMSLRALQSGQAVQAAHYSTLAEGVNAFLGARFRLAAHATIDYLTTGTYDEIDTSTQADHVVPFFLDPVSNAYQVGLVCAATTTRLVASSERTRVDATLCDASGAALSSTLSIYGTDMAPVPEGERGITYQPSGSTLPIGQEGLCGYTTLGWLSSRYLTIDTTDRGQAAYVLLECYGVRVYSCDVIGVQTGELT